MDEQRWLTFDLFQDRIGERFALLADGTEPLAVELVEATESGQAGGPGPGGTSRLQFSLVFLGPQEPLLPQATYALEHGDLGRLDLFLVPIGRGPGGVRYEAAFG